MPKAQKPVKASNIKKVDKLEIFDILKGDIKYRRPGKDKKGNSLNSSADPPL